MKHHCSNVQTKLSSGRLVVPILFPQRPGLEVDGNKLNELVEVSVFFGEAINGLPVGIRLFLCGEQDFAFRRIFGIEQDNPDAVQG